MVAVVSSELAKARSKVEHVVVRPVIPGSWQPCAHCNETIEFVPGADRIQATAKTCIDGQVRRVRHFHNSCYREWGHLYGEPI